MPSSWVRKNFMVAPIEIGVLKLGHEIRSLEVNKPAVRMPGAQRPVDLNHDLLLMNAFESEQPDVIRGDSNASRRPDAPGI
jgi:hypothetical protein